MVQQRVDMHRLQELVRLHRLGRSARRVARLLKMGRSTEQQYREAIAKAGLLEGSPEDLPSLEQLQAAIEQRIERRSAPQQESSVAVWRTAIEKMVERGAGAKAIHDFLRLDEDDFSGSLSAVKRLRLQIVKVKGIDPASVAIPVETAPGEVAQVDFGFVGKIYDPEAGVRRKAWVFVMTLGFSRKGVSLLAFDQKVETWLECHILAFEELGGVIKVVVPDNLKAAVIRCAFGIDQETTLNRSYRELARYYGFTIDPTPPRSPEKKGKAEAGVKYVRNNFFKPRDPDAMDAVMVRRDLARWQHEIADVRVHGTTGQRPIDLFEQEEKAALLPLPKERYELVVWKEATVHPDSHVLYDKKLYSVPFQHIGRRVWIRASAASVVVYFDDKRIATHPRRCHGSRSTCDEHLPEHRVSLRYRSRDYWESKAKGIGPEVALLVNELFDSDKELSKLRVVQAIVGMLRQYPAERAEAACRRARRFGNYSYQGLKSILHKGLDLQPLLEGAPTSASLEKPRFARSASELLASKLRPNLEIQK